MLTECSPNCAIARCRYAKVHPSSRTLEIATWAFRKIVLAGRGRETIPCLNHDCFPVHTLAPGVPETGTQGFLRDQELAPRTSPGKKIVTKRSLMKITSFARRCPTRLQDPFYAGHFLLNAKCSWSTATCRMRMSVKYRHPCDI